MPSERRRKPGPPVDEEAREEAVELRAEILAAGFTIADVAREARLASVARYQGVTAALRGVRTNKPAVAKMRRALDRLTQRETAEVSP